MTAILGLSAYYHDAAAALLIDGQIVAAAQEERFTRKKHDAGFPTHAVDFCLASAGITFEQIDHVAFYEKPLLKFDRLLETYLAFAPSGFASFRKAMPIWLKEKLFQDRELRRGLPGPHRRKIIYGGHHQTHAASAFFPSPFDDAAILTLDGVGEWDTASYGVGRGNRVRLLRTLHFPHSLGLLYSAFTYYCGFKVNSGEYKLMGLAPYGEPRFADVIRRHLIDVREDGSLWMDMSYFNYCQGLTMTSRKFDELFGGPPRQPESPIGERHMDLAASVQAVTEDVILRAGRHLHHETGMRRLCLAGGVALNCVANGKLLRNGPFDEIWIQPAAGDSGGALGAALHVWHQLLDKPRQVNGGDAMSGGWLGPAFSDAAIHAHLDSVGAVYHTFDTDEALCERVADLIAREQVVGWFQDRMEFGPRALGARSILGDARSAGLQSTMNVKIKFRESFRPFAPVVLKERAHEYFDLAPGTDSPYMLLVAPVKAERRRETTASSSARGLDRVKEVRSDIPAVTHVDYSARVQTVDEGRHKRFHTLLKTFERKTGCPVMINTSFNVRGEPIVCSPQDAYRCFMGTDMDVLVLERSVLVKTEQPASAMIDRERYIGAFHPD